MNLGELARLVAGRLRGGEEFVVEGLAGIREATPEEITFAWGRYRELIGRSRAGAFLLAEEADTGGRPQVLVEPARLEGAVLLLARHFHPPAPPPSPGVDPRAVVGPGARLGRGVSVGPGAVLEDGCQVGDNARVGAGAYLGHGVRVGADSVLHPRVVLLAGTIVGARVTIYPGAVLGADGFGFEADGRKQPQLGIVEVEDDVEIGANATIDRARFSRTLIGRGAKLDNLVHIAHNVTVGAGCRVSALVGVAGSARLGAGVVLGGQAGVADHVQVGDGVLAAARAGLTRDVPAGQRVSGFPAREHQREQRDRARVHRLEGEFAELRRLRRRLEALERRAGDASAPAAGAGEAKE